MIDLLLWFVAVLMVFGVGFYLLELIPGIPPPFKQVIRVLLALMLVLAFIHAMAPGGILRMPWMGARP